MTNGLRRFGETIHVRRKKKSEGEERGENGEEE
jgi:hypothetical protein